MFKRYLIFFLLLLLPLLPVLAQDSTDNTLIRGIPAGPDTLNSVTQNSGADFAVQAYLWPNIYELDPMTGFEVPSLTSWEISEDGLVYTFTIREDVVWSDGTPITAQDVAFTYGAIQSDLVTTRRSLTRFDGIQVIDDKTFQVVLSEPYCGIWEDLRTRIMPAHKFAPDYSDFMTTDFNIAPDIAGGPYILEEFAKDEFIRFRANPSYFKGQPNIDTFIMRILPDADIRVQSLIVGDVDWVIGIRPDDVTTLQQNPDLVSYQTPANSLIFIVLNLADPANPMPALDADGNRVEQPPHPIFGDVRVRQAIAMGWNKDEALVVLGEGTSRIPGTIAPAIPWAFNSELEPWPYDPEAAGALLDEAGWPLNEETGIRECRGCLYAEEGTPLEFLLDMGSGTADPIGLIFQDQLREVGVQVNVQVSESGVFADRAWPQQFDAVVMNYGAPAGEVHVLSHFLLSSSQDDPSRGLNLASYSNPKVDELLEKAQSVPGCSTEERAPYYYELQQIVHDEVAYDMVADAVEITYFSGRVQGVIQGPAGFNDINEWSIAN